MQIPKGSEPVYLLQRHMVAQSLNVTTLSASMQAFGWATSWPAAYLTNLFAGKVKMDEERKLFVIYYLANY